MKVSFYINTFWFHVTFDKAGNIGRDQHGRIWFNAENPVDESGLMKPHGY